MEKLYKFNQFLNESSVGDFAQDLSNKLDFLKDFKEEEKEKEKEKLPLPFKNNDEGNAFRKWVNDKYPTYAQKIDLSSSSSKKDGYNNKYIKEAWEKYGEEYTKDKK